MSAVGQATAADIGGRAARRLAALDPLLPEVAELPSGCGAVFTAADISDQPTAIGACEHWAGEPGAIELTWSAARRFRLIPAIAGPDVASALDLLISQWCDHLADVEAADVEDSAAGVAWPSRDAEGIRVLLRHGLAPRAVVAARRTRPVRDGRAYPSDVVIRRAGPADLDAVTSLGMALIRYDNYFGSVLERPETEAAVRRGSADLLAKPEPWIWLAKRDDVTVGMLAAEPPAVASWIAPMTRLAPVAYLQQGFVLPAERGSGIGAMLTAAFHAELAKAGVPIALLHYSQVNPLSAPFWSQQGYRPLWTTWEARPARSLR